MLLRALAHNVLEGAPVLLVLLLPPELLALKVLLLQPCFMPPFNLLQHARRVGLAVFACEREGGVAALARCACCGRINVMQGT